MINCTITFHTAKNFGCLCSIMKSSSINYGVRLHYLFICFKIMHYRICHCTNYQIQWVPLTAWTASIIIIIIKLYWSCWFSQLSLSIHLNYPLFLAGLPNYILCLQSPDVNKFFLIGHHWHVHVLGSMEERDLWVHPCLSTRKPFDSPKYICIYIYSLGE